MAIQDNDFFTPDMVDEQIEQLSPGPNLSQQRITASSQLIRDLRYFYRTNSQEEDTRSLQQAWQRISHDKTDLLTQYLDYRQDTSSGTGQSANLNNLTFPKQRNLQQRLSMIAVVAVVIILIGSMALAVNFIRPQNTVGSTVIATATHNTITMPASSTISLSQNVGKIVYTASYGFNDIYAVAWSPDSQRIATANNNNVQAIDAANGNHAVNYSISPAYSVAWSPEGHRIAASSDRVYIWDASSARLLRAYPPHVSAGINTTAAIPKRQQPVPPCKLTSDRFLFLYILAR